MATGIEAVVPAIIAAGASIGTAASTVGSALGAIPGLAGTGLSALGSALPEFLGAVPSALGEGLTGLAGVLEGGSEGFLGGASLFEGLGGGASNAFGLGAELPAAFSSALPAGAELAPEAAGLSSTGEALFSAVPGTEAAFSAVPEGMTTAVAGGPSSGLSSGEAAQSVFQMYDLLGGQKQGQQQLSQNAPGGGGASFTQKRQFAPMGQAYQPRPAVNGMQPKRKRGLSGLPALGM